MPQILLADDNLTTQKVFQLSLEGEDADVHCFNTGQSLLAQLEAESAELVALNLSLPDGNGYDLCRQIKSNPLYAHIPVVLLVGAFQTFDEERAKAAGCTAHLSKPFETSELVQLVRSLWNQESVEEQSVRDGDKAPEGGSHLLPLKDHQTLAGIRLLERELHLSVVSPEESPSPSPADREARAEDSPDIPPAQMEEIVQRLSDRLPQELRRILPELLSELRKS